ncbi:hypothetical protein Y032_0078g1219 [Ancylostoma ceylanicum]|uniref:Uncharacterized protein n=1 Tax=Ancylostoma ceylanicum TaxID=53326 RepID=A0A016TU64_9BILA|nr:hypothetical protein Y032_0078g1219 [Ancylostoma ceylanicum]
MPDENSHSLSMSADGEASDTDSQRTVDRISMGSNDSKKIHANFVFGSKKKLADKLPSFIMTLSLKYTVYERTVTVEIGFVHGEIEILIPTPPNFFPRPPTLFPAQRTLSSKRNSTGTRDKANSSWLLSALLKIPPLPIPPTFCVRHCWVVHCQEASTSKLGVLLDKAKSKGKRLLNKKDKERSKSPGVTETAAQCIIINPPSSKLVGEKDKKTQAELQQDSSKDPYMVYSLARRCRSMPFFKYRMMLLGALLSVTIVFPGQLEIPLFEVFTSHCHRIYVVY